MDETTMYFDLPRNCTVDSGGTKTAPVKTTGQEKMHFKPANSPLMVIFKYKAVLKEKISLVFTIRMNAGVVIQWLWKVLLD